MHKNSFVYNRVFYFAASAAVVAALSLGPAGCSKEQKSAETTTAQPAVASSAAAAKEHFDKGVQFSMKGDLDGAIKEFDETLKLDPKSAEAHNNIGFAYYDKGDTDKAIEHQKMALENNPNLANGYFGLAMALEKKGDKEGAIANWKEFMKLAQPHSKWWMQAQAHIKNLEGKTAKKNSAPQHKK